MRTRTAEGAVWPGASAGFYKTDMSSLTPRGEALRKRVGGCRGVGRLARPLECRGNGSSLGRVQSPALGFAARSQAPAGSGFVLGEGKLKSCKGQNSNWLENTRLCPGPESPGPSTLPSRSVPPRADRRERPLLPKAWGDATAGAPGGSPLPLCVGRFPLSPPSLRAVPHRGSVASPCPACLAEAAHEAHSVAQRCRAPCPTGVDVE